MVRVVPDYVVNIGAQVDETTTAQIMQMELGSPGMAMVGAMNDALAAGFGSVAVRFIGEPDTVHPVKALLGVLADDDVTDSEIDAFVAGYVTPLAASEEDEAGPQYLFADLPFGRVRFAQRGDGEAAIVLVHGFGGDLDNWLFNIDALAEQATVYAFDLPGHGQSSKGITDPTLRGLSQALFAFIDEVGVGTAHLVGHSLGGAVAMQAEIDAPDRVQSLPSSVRQGSAPRSMPSTSTPLSRRPRAASSSRCSSICSPGRNS